MKELQENLHHCEDFFAKYGGKIAKMMER